MAFQKGHTGFARRNFAVGGKERVNLAAHRIVFDSGVELDIQGHHTPGHARLLAMEYMTKTKRADQVIVSTTKIPIDPEVENIRKG